MKRWQFQGWLILLLALSSQRSFVEGAPTVVPRQGSPEVIPETLDANVRELESLKQSIGKTLEMMKSHSSMYSDINGHRENHSESRSEVKEDGTLVAGIGHQMDSSDGQGSAVTSVDIPSKDIHKTIKQKLITQQQPQQQQQQQQQEKRSQSFEDDSNSLLEKSATQYSPLDMAEYVFWTGDEKGVTLAIEEFLQEGLISREEAIAFLQEIKFNLDYLQSHYTQLGLNWDRSKENVQQLSKPKNSATVSQLPNRPELKSKFDISRLRSQMKKSESTKVLEAADEAKAETLDDQQQEDYDELLERLRMADFLYTEYSLEEVIYQLAKVMFTQSLTRGSAEAQQALQKFTTFLESEADQGHISRALEKKVLDVLIAALTDTLSEHPELHDPDIHAQHEKQVLHQILQMVPKNKELEIQLKGPLTNLGKYKTIR